MKNEFTHTFCLKLGKNATEKNVMIKAAFGGDSLSCSLNFEWLNGLSMIGRQPKKIIHVLKDRQHPETMI